LFYNKLKSMVY
ncbi:hypothetical protein CP061683_0072B, partial [Chlamydia psittaci 06-1683]